MGAWRNQAPLLRIIISKLCRIGHNLVFAASSQRGRVTATHQALMLPYQTIRQVSTHQTALLCLACISFYKQEDNLLESSSLRLMPLVHARTYHE